MATRRFSTAPGDAFPHGIVQAAGAATVSKPIEVTVDLGNVVQGNTRPLSKQDVLQALHNLKTYVASISWPPA